MSGACSLEVLSTGWGWGCAAPPALGASQLACGFPDPPFADCSPQSRAAEILSSSTNSRATGVGVLGPRPVSGPVERRPAIPLPHRACLGCSLLHTTLSLLLLRATRRVLEVRSKSPSSAETTAVTPAGWNCTQKGLTPNVQGTGHTRARLSFKTPLKISPGKTAQVGTGEALVTMAPPSYMQSPPPYFRAWFPLVCVCVGGCPLCFPPSSTALPALQGMGS